MKCFRTSVRCTWSRHRYTLTTLYKRSTLRHVDYAVRLPFGRGFPVRLRRTAELPKLRAIPTHKKLRITNRQTPPAFGLGAPAICPDARLCGGTFWIFGKHRFSENIKSHGFWPFHNQNDQRKILRFSYFFKKLFFVCWNLDFWIFRNSSFSRLWGYISSKFEFSMKFHPISYYFQLSTTFGEGVKMPWKIFPLLFGQKSTCENLAEIWIFGFWDFSKFQLFKTLNLQIFKNRILHEISPH